MEYGASYNNELTLQVYNAATAGYDLNLTYTGSPVKSEGATSLGYSTHQFTATRATLNLIITNLALLCVIILHHEFTTI